MFVYLLLLPYSFSLTFIQAQFSWRGVLIFFVLRYRAQSMMFYHVFLHELRVLRTRLNRLNYRSRKYKIKPIQLRIHNITLQ